MGICKILIQTQADCPVRACLNHCCLHLERQSAGEKKKNNPRFGIHILIMPFRS